MSIEKRLGDLEQEFGEADYCPHVAMVVVRDGIEPPGCPCGMPPRLTVELVCIDPPMPASGLLGP